ncbi:hypothetical protein [Myxosarcina sp. GI1]|uniref:hypothetical protein n=1 Tax=Myxosarcina sp. GI1 TaxID=1541065 RepID=UPI0012E053B1|nr:hypothetical protein [Myxosarcina sp. GI1]
MKRAHDGTSVQICPMSQHYNLIILAYVQLTKELTSQQIRTKYQKNWKQLQNE